jgi:hypothetical protein
MPSAASSSRAARRPAGRRASPTRSELDLRWALAGLAAVSAALAPGAPTGMPVADAVWRMAFAVVVVLSAYRAPRATWLFAGCVAALAGLSTGGSVAVVGVAALGVALLGAVSHRRIRLLGAVVGCLVVHVVLRIDLDGTGTSVLVAIVAVAPLVITAWLRADRRTRRYIRIGLLVALFSFLAAAVLLAIAVGLIYRDVESAGDAMQDGLNAIRDNEPTIAVDRLDVAAAGFDAADGRLRALSWPARLVPILGHQARALDVVTSSGGELAETATTATSEADLDELRFDQGALDLDLVANMEEPLADARDALVRADERFDEARTMRLLGPLASVMDDVGDEVAEAVPDADLALQGVRVAPQILGADGERHYYVAFTQPAEARGLGGFIGNFGELTAVDGDLTLSRSGRIAEVVNAPGADDRVLSGPDDYLDRYGRFHPAQFMQDLTFSPDGPTVAQVMEELYPQAGGRPVDGVLIVDPVALGAFMEFTGPITVSGLDEPLTSENAADFLLREQYLTFQDDQAGRIDFLDEASRVTFERLTSGQLPGPRELADTLGGIVDQGRLILHMVDPDEQALIERVGLDGALPDVDGGDFVSLTTQNGGNNKIDMFLRRSIDYTARWNPETGAVRAQARITLSNLAPATGLPPIVLSNRDPEHIPQGTNVSLVSFYTPFALEGARLDGEPVGVETQQELDRWVYGKYVQVPPGGQVTLTFRLSGFVEPGTEYRLGFAPQPLVNADQVRLRVVPEAGWAATDPNGFTVGPTAATATFRSDEDLSLRLSALRDAS